MVSGRNRFNHSLWSEFLRFCAYVVSYILHVRHFIFLSMYKLNVQLCVQPYFNGRNKSSVNFRFFWIREKFEAKSQKSCIWSLHFFTSNWVVGHSPSFQDTKIISILYLEIYNNNNKNNSNNNSNNNDNNLYMYRVSIFSRLSCLKFYFSSPFFPDDPFHVGYYSLSLISGFTSCIHEFRGLPFLVLPGGYHFNFFL